MIEPSASKGMVKKIRQRRSLASARHDRAFAAFGLTDLPLFAVFVLTYYEYAPRAKRVEAFMGHGHEIFNSPLITL